MWMHLRSWQRHRHLRKGDVTGLRRAELAPMAVSTQLRRWALRGLATFSPLPPETMETSHTVTAWTSDSPHVLRPSVGALMAERDWYTSAAHAAGTRHNLAHLDYAPVVPRPEKIICVGPNYRSHILEMGREIPEYPTLFAKSSGALIGAYERHRSARGVERGRLGSRAGRGDRSASAPVRTPRRLRAPSPATAYSTMSPHVTGRTAVWNGCRARRLSPPRLSGRIW
jgi:hypothetical protein